MLLWIQAGCAIQSNANSLIVKIPDGNTGMMKRWDMDMRLLSRTPDALRKKSFDLPPPRIVVI